MATGDFDEKVGMDVIKESMGLTDSDFQPQDMGGDEQFEGGDDAQTFGDQFDGGAEDQQRAPAERTPREPTRAREGDRGRAPQDPLRQPAPLRFDPNATFRPDKKGNLVDAKTGQVIARAGSEARIYSRVHKEATSYIQSAMRNAGNQLRDQHGKLQRAVELGLGFEKQLSELRQNFNRINAHQLNTDQLLEAAQYYKQAQTDPVGTLKSLLARAALSGVDITQLGVKNDGAFDSRAIVDMLRKEINTGLEPVKQYTTEQKKNQEDQQVQTQYLQRAEREVSDFFQNTPAAVPFIGAFHAILSQPQFQQMSLSAIWDKLQIHLMRQQRQRRGNGAPTRQPSRSLPSGQGMAPSGGDTGRSRGDAPAHPSMSYDQIIREVLGTAAR